MKFFVRSFLFIAAIVAVGLWSSHASAALPITESFNYTDGSTLLSGSGGAWVQAFPNTGNTNNINIINGSLTGPPELKSSSANSIAITGGGTSSNSADRIPFGQTVTSSAANTVYYSFLLKVTETTGSNFDLKSDAK